MAWGSERWLLELKAFNMQNWDQCWVGKSGSVWQLTVDCLYDCKSAEHEKEQCLEDYHCRFGHVETLCKNGAKRGFSEYHQVSSN